MISFNLECCWNDLPEISEVENLIEGDLFFCSCYNIYYKVEKYRCALT